MSRSPRSGSRSPRGGSKERKSPSKERAPSSKERATPSPSNAGTAPPTPGSALSFSIGAFSGAEDEPEEKHSFFRMGKCSKAIVGVLGWCFDLLICRTRARKRARKRSVWAKKHFPDILTRKVTLRMKQKEAYTTMVNMMKLDLEMPTSTYYCRILGQAPAPPPTHPAPVCLGFRA